MSLLAELQRRNVFRVAAAYVVAAWLIIQVVETLFPVYGLSNAAIRLVVTLLAIGFVIAVALSWAFELTPDGLKKETEIDRSQSITSQTGKKLDRLIIVVLVLALGFFAFDKFVLDPQRDAEEIEVATEAAVEQAIAEAGDALPDASIAVLPFENFSGKEEDEYFSDGLSDTVLHQLAQVSGLKVIARNSSFQFKGQNLDVREIGERLDVANVLEGSVQRYGDQVRVIAQLIRASDGAHVWSQSFDYKMEDIFALHDAIAAAVVVQMKVSLLPEDRYGFDQARTDVPAAYDLLLKAVNEIYRTFTPAVADQVDPDDFASMKLLDEALALDPDYVDALLEKVFLYNMFAFQGSNIRNLRAYMDRARPYLDRAMELAPDYSSVWAAKGAIAHRTGDIVTAVEAYERAIELNPNDAAAHLGLAVAIIEQDPVGTIEHMRIARRLDPENPFKRPIVLALARLGRLDEARHELETGLKGIPGLDQMTLNDLIDINYVAFGRIDESARWAGKLIAMQPDSVRGVIGLARAWMAVGELDRADRWLPPITDDEAVSDFTKILRIRLEMVQGEFDKAKVALQSLGMPRGPVAGVVLNIKARLCLVASDLVCAREAVDGYGTVLEMAAARDPMMVEWQISHRLLEAALAERSGESPREAAEAVIERTRALPRTSWAVGVAADYMDAEAFVLLDQPELAIQALEESLLADGGIMPFDSFSMPADNGLVLSALDSHPDFQDWRERFRARREAMREKMLEMEAAGEIPAPPDSSPE